MVSSCHQPQTLQQHPSWIPLSGTRTLVNRPFIKVSLLFHLFRLFPPDMLIDPINKHHLTCFRPSRWHLQPQQSSAGGGGGGSKGDNSFMSLQEAGNLCQMSHPPPLPSTAIGSNESYTLSDSQKKKREKKELETKGRAGILLGSVTLGIRNNKEA